MSEKNEEVTKMAELILMILAQDTSEKRPQDATSAVSDVAPWSRIARLSSFAIEPHLIYRNSFLDQIIWPSGLVSTGFSGPGLRCQASKLPLCFNLMCAIRVAGLARSK